MAAEVHIRTPKIVLVIPVFNHRKTLRDVVVKSLAVCRDVMVIDDGSTDRGTETLSGLDVRIIRHPENRGKGAAIMTAAREADLAGATHMVTIDADGQHDPADFTKFASMIDEDPAAIIIGLRAFDPDRTPISSRFGRSFSNFWVKVQTGCTLKDTQSGFRAYPVGLLQWLRLGREHYDFEVEVLVKAAWAGVELKEVDVSVFYPPSTERVSHFNPFVDNLRLSLLNTMLTLRAVMPVPHREFVPAGKEMEKISVLSPIRSLKILLAGNTSPERLAMAGGLGVFLGAVPLIACQTVTILFAANSLRLNKLMALGASQICIPPLVPAMCIEVGYFIRHGTFLTEVSLRTLGYQGLERIFEWFLGSLVLGPVLGVVAAGAIYIIAMLLKRGVLEND